MLKPDENYAIVDAQDGLRQKMVGKTIRIIPPSKPYL